MATPYPKKWISIQEQIDKLKQAGLSIGDEVAAEAFLKHINYYRFSGYALAFEQKRHHFLPGTSFQKIREAYEFDRALRDLFTESIEVIELDLRTNMAYSLGQKYGPFGHVNVGNFFRQFSHQGWLDKLHEETERSSELFVVHYKNKYQEYPNLPIWVAMEIMSLERFRRCMEAY